MSEEEIIEIIEDIIKNLNGEMEIKHTNFNKIKAIQGLLDLYNKEKEKNRDLQIFVDDVKEGVYIDYPEFEEKYISKDKIKEKIKELDKMICYKRKSQIKYSTIDEIIFDKKIEVLQELLKGE